MIATPFSPPRRRCPAATRTPPMPRPARAPRLVVATLAIALLVGAPAHAPLAQVRLPALGESAADEFSVSAERRLGEQIMREVRRDPDYLDDPLLLEYLQALWAPLVLSARQRGDIESGIETQFAWEAFLVRDRSVNAFALPGGFVGVHLGLIAMTATPDELASVLAHELTHVTQRHIARGMVNSQRQSLLSVAAMILGVLAASRANNTDMAQAAVMGGQAAAIQGQLNFSRDMEREADRIGAGVLSQAGFDTAGMASMFDKLDQGSRLNDSGAFPYLRSHPLTTERASEARLRATSGRRATDGPAAPGWHTLMQARARVLMDANTGALERLADLPATRRGTSAADRAGQLYAAALAASRLRQHPRALQWVSELRAHQRELPTRDAAADRALQMLDAETRLAASDAAGAVAVLEALAAGGVDRPLLLLRAQAALALPAPARADALRRSTEALQTWVALRARDAAAWELLASCADALGLRLRALRAHAEARFALGDLPGAVDRLRAGRLAARGAAEADFIESSIIESRLRELEGMRRQLAAESRGNRGPRDERDDREGRDDGDPPRRL